MNVILGANGIIASQLAKELAQNYSKDIRLVSRNPKKINETDTLFQADLLDPRRTIEAVEGCKTAYMTVGLPIDSKIWAVHWAILMKNIITACKIHQTKLVFFDNTYMYGKTDKPIFENEPFRPNGIKGKARAEIAQMLINEIDRGGIEAVISRAPEFYGPKNTMSITNSTIFENIKNKKKLKVFLRDDTFRTLIYTPDASRAMALIGNTPDAFNQTWHLPCDDNRMTYRQWIKTASEFYGEQFDYTVLSKFLIRLVGIFNRRIGETVELLPRYEVDNLFDSSKFKKRFPEFKITSYHEGIKTIIEEIKTIQV
jgi:nucleoside-diphosphate-sugar epimerase